MTIVARAAAAKYLEPDHAVAFEAIRERHTAVWFRLASNNDVVVVCSCSEQPGEPARDGQRFRFRGQGLSDDDVTERVTSNLERHVTAVAAMLLRSTPG
jgi:hypothetical protein